MERKKGVLLNQLPGLDSQRALDPHPGQASPHSSLRASKGEHQAGAQPCPKGPQRPLRQRPLSWLPSQQQAQVGVMPGWGLRPLGGKKPTNQPSLAPGSSLGVPAFPFHHHHHL